MGTKKVKKSSSNKEMRNNKSLTGINCQAFFDLVNGNSVITVKRFASF